MIDREHLTGLRALTMATDAAVVALTWLGLTVLRAWLVASGALEWLPPSLQLHEVSVPLHAWLVVLIVPAWILSLAASDAYMPTNGLQPEGHRWRIARACVLATLGLLGLLFAIHVTEYLSRSLFLTFAAASFPALMLGRLVLRRTLGRSPGRLDQWNLLVVGTEAEVAQVADTLAAHQDWGIRLVGRVSPGPEAAAGALGTIDELTELLETTAVHQVYMTGRQLDTERLRQVADVCDELGVRFSIDADFLGLRTARARLDHLEGWSLLTFSSTPSHADALALKRIIDVVGSLVLLLTTAPLLLLVSLLIRLESKGPIFFDQVRAGQHGRRFRMWKFRSMVADAEERRPALDHLNEMSGPVFKMRADPRVTRVGAVIRRLSIDELPQLLNVLRGEMSLVGPRPPLVGEVARYQRWQMRRLSMKPGLTCIWQVSGRNEVDFDDWMRLDLQYIDNWSLSLDLKLLMMTIPAVLLGSGAR